MLPCPVLDNDQVAALADMRELIDVVETCFIARAQHRLTAPPRHMVEFAGPQLVFTIGGMTEPNGGGIAGFRVYESAPGVGAAHDQLTAVWDTATHRLAGLVVGERLGALRTGAIGGVALRYMAPLTARTLCVIGTGRQAETQVMAAMAVLPSLTHILVFGRNAANRAAFAARLEDRFDMNVHAVDTARQAVEGADVVICATSSEQPVIDTAWLAPGVHLSTLGAKSSDRHEVPRAVGDLATWTATDSPEQARSYKPGFFLDGTPGGAAMRDLADIVHGGTPIRQSARDMTLFCSVGLAGTEVAVASALLRRAGGTT
jgi:ornithine cyclodeaminase